MLFMLLNKKTMKILCLLLPLSALLSSCADPKQVSSSGTTDLTVEKEEKDYLDTEIIKKKKETSEAYEIHVIGYGDFVEEELNADSIMGNYLEDTLRAELGEDTMTVVNTDLLVQDWGYQAMQGDVLMTVEMDVEEADILEARLKLQRLQNSFERAKTEFAQQREEAIAENDQIGDKYEFQAGCFLLERDALEWENTVRNYERQIAEAQKRVNQLEKWKNTTTITAPESGFYYLDTTGEDGGLKPGDTLKSGDIICKMRISTLEQVDILDNKENKWEYGAKVLFETSGKNITGEMETSEWEGRIASGSVKDLYGNLDVRKADSSDSLLMPSIQTFSNPAFSLSRAISEDAFFGQTKAKGSIKEMKQVLLVPARAVTVEEEIPYVTVIKPDGGFLKTGFIAGGHNDEYYWVFSGLEEGTEILMSK